MKEKIQKYIKNANEIIAFFKAKNITKDKLNIENNFFLFGTLSSNEKYLNREFFEIMQELLQLSDNTLLILLKKAKTNIILTYINENNIKEKVSFVDINILEYIFIIDQYIDTPISDKNSCEIYNRFSPYSIIKLSTYNQIFQESFREKRTKDISNNLKQDKRLQYVYKTLFKLKNLDNFNFDEQMKLFLQKNNIKHSTIKLLEKAQNSKTMEENIKLRLLARITDKNFLNLMKKFHEESDLISKKYDKLINCSRKKENKNKLLEIVT